MFIFSQKNTDFTKLSKNLKIFFPCVYNFLFYQILIMWWCTCFGWFVSIRLAN